MKKHELLNQYLNREGPTVHLIGVGRVKAIPAEQLQPGQWRLFNYGYVEKIVGIEKKNGWVIVKYEGSHRVYERRHKATTPIPITTNDNGRRYNHEGVRDLRAV